MFRPEMRVTKTLRIAWGIVASAIVAWGGGSTARAGEPAKAVAHKVVDFKDLNLNSAEGVEMLYRRLRSAAGEFCADPDRYDRSEVSLPCIDEVMSRAITQINSPMLTSLYQAKTGKADKKKPTLARVHGVGL
jgi:UrcA family protein